MTVPSKTHRRPGGPYWARGVTLIEMMIVVAMVGIIAAIAVPNLMPIIHAQKIAGAAESVANVLERARRKAIGTGFCHRVRDGGNGILLLDERTVPDCVNNIANASWANIGRINAETGVTLQIETMASNVPVNVIIFRPNGRLRGDNDLDTRETDDGARVSVRHPSTTRAIDVFVTSLGRICADSYHGTKAMPAAVTCGLGTETTAGTNPSCGAVDGEGSLPLVGLLAGLFAFRRRRPKRRGKRKRTRAARGYLLIETMASGAILAVILSAAVTAVATHRFETARASRRAQASMYAQEALAFAIAQWPPLCPPAALAPPAPFTLTCAITIETALTTSSTPELNEDMNAITVNVSYPSVKEGETKTTTHQARVRARNKVAAP